MPTGTSAEPSRLRRVLSGLTLNVFLLGLVSFLTDASSEMIVPLMPLFFALPSVGHGVAAPVIIGLLEGISEAVSALVKLLAGVRTDRAERKKRLILVGYGLSSLARPLMGLATAWWHPVAVRAADRIGKGIRSAPRDVLIAESTPKECRGKAFGFHRSMDHLGAVVGPLIAVALLGALYKPGLGAAGRDSALRAIFLLAVVPGLISMAIILFWVRDVRSARTGEPFRLAWGVLDAGFRKYLVCLALFTLGNTADLFLINRAVEVMAAGGTFARGLPALAIAPLLWAFFHLFKMLSAAPLGSLSDRLGRRNLIRLGWGVYALVYLGFAFMDRPWQAWPLFAAYALYYGLTEGAEKALVVDLAPGELRGTAMGMYYFTIGAATLPANVLFGLVYRKFGPPAAFGYAAALACLAMALLSQKSRMGTSRRPA